MFDNAVHELLVYHLGEDDGMVAAGAQLPTPPVLHDDRAALALLSRPAGRSSHALARRARRVRLALCRAALGPHGVLMWGHFLEGCEVFAPPRRKSVQLERGWLRSLCAPPHWNVFEDREAQLSTRNETVPAESFAAARTK